MRLPVTFAAALALLAAPLSGQVDRRTLGTATLEDVPPVPPEVKAAAQRYQGGSIANLAGWRTDGGLRVLTRAAGLIQLHDVGAAGGTTLNFAADSVGVPRVVPGSDRLIFSRDSNGDEWFQLYAMAPGGPPVQLTEDGTRNEGLVLRRDGGRMFWARAQRGSADCTIEAADPSDPATRTTLYRASGAVIPTDLSPDASQLLLIRAVSNTAHELLLLDLADRSTRPIFRGQRAIATDARFAPDGKSVFVLSNRGGDARRLIAVDLATDRARPISPPSRWDVEDYAISGDGRTAAWSLNVEGASIVTVRDLATGRELSRPRLPLGVLNGMEFSPDGQRLAIGLSSPNAPGDIWTWSVDGRDVTRWTATQAGFDARRQLPEPRIVRYESFDRLSVPALVYRPLAAPAGKRTPVLISIHGGPEAQARPGWAPAIGYFTESLGATVIVPNVRGSDGYGRRYLDLDNGTRREDAVRDIGALLDWIRRQPDLDPDRVAVIGGSYGGYMVMASLARYGARLVGGVNSFGIGDWTTFLQNTESYRRDNRRAEYGDERDPRTRRFFDRISPRANVRRITTPLLIAQGENDPRVPASESENMVAALRQQGVPVSYLRFADEGHGWRRKANIDLAREVETVFLQRLFDGKAGSALAARR